ncbi:hypothetical protein GCM10009837_58480 [Streptomyces durmitorensis]
MREGTTRTGLGRLRPGVAHSSLWAGCFSHLQKPYVRWWRADRRNGNLSWGSHTFFTCPDGHPRSRVWHGALYTHVRACAETCGAGIFPLWGDPGSAECFRSYAIRRARTRPR